MKPRVVYRAEARRDLVVNFVFLSETADLDRAHRFRAAVDEACCMLAEMPMLGARRRFRRKALARARIWTIKEFPNFLIVYEPMTGGGIRLIRVVHTKEDYWRILD